MKFILEIHRVLIEFSMVATYVSSAKAVYRFGKFAGLGYCEFTDWFAIHVRLQHKSFDVITCNLERGVFIFENKTNE